MRLPGLRRMKEDYTYVNKPDPTPQTSNSTPDTSIVTFTGGSPYSFAPPPYAEAVDDGDPDGTLTAAEIYARNTEGV